MWVSDDARKHRLERTPSLNKSEPVIVSFLPYLSGYRFRCEYSRYSVHCFFYNGHKCMSFGIFQLFCRLHYILLTSGQLWAPSSNDINSANVSHAKLKVTDVLVKFDGFITVSGTRHVVVTIRWWC